MDALANMLPWWVALGLIALSYVVARKFNLGPGAKPFLAALRAALWLKVRRDRPKLRLVVTPQPEVDEGGIVPPSNGIEFGDPNNPGGGPTGGEG